MNLADVTKLDQLKWYFDGTKVSTLVKTDFITQLEKVKDAIFAGNGKILFEEYFDTTFRNSDDLINALKGDDSWFNLIFQIK